MDQGNGQIDEEGACRQIDVDGNDGRTRRLGVSTELVDLARWLVPYVVACVARRTLSLEGWQQLWVWWFTMDGWKYGIV